MSIRERSLRPRTAALAVVALLAVQSCAPRVRPLGGAPAPASLPRAELPAERQRIVFRWDFRDESFGARGEGVARIAPPDSARLDLFVSGGFGSGHAIVIGDSIFVPGDQRIRRFLPPPAMLWAALGRLAVPAVADTSARLEGDILRADIGRDPRWRVTFAGGRLARLELIRRERVVEELTREAGSDIRWRNHPARRSLTLKIERTEKESSFDAAIWRR